MLLRRSGLGPAKRLALTVACVSNFLSYAPAAHAELTDSQKEQVRSYVESGDLGTVPRLRALIARPDLSELQASALFSAAVRPHTFDDRCQAYLELLLFGPASQASRSVVSPPVVRALVARADAIFVQVPGDPMRDEGPAGRELMRIHRFVEDILARAAASETDGVASLHTDARRSIAKAYEEHIQRHRTWLSFDSRVRGKTLLLRAQVALVLRRAAEGAMQRKRTAETLGLGPAARGLFLRTGVLLDDGGMGPEIRRSEVVSMLDKVPSALNGVDMVIVAKTSRADWTSQSRVMFLRTSLGPVAPRRRHLWASSVGTADPEEAVFETAWVASSSAIRKRLADDRAYANRIEQVLINAAGKGSFGFVAPWVVERSIDRDAWQSTNAIGVVDFAAAVTTLLLLDVERTVDLAATRYVAARPESFEQVLLGLDILAPAASSGGNAEIELGKVTQAGVEPVTVQVLVKGGRVVGLALGEHRYEADFGPNGRIQSLQRNGAPLEVHARESATGRTHRKADGRSRWPLSFAF